MCRVQIDLDLHVDLLCTATDDASDICLSMVPNCMCKLTSLPVRKCIIELPSFYRIDILRRWEVDLGLHVIVMERAMFI